MPEFSRAAQARRKEAQPGAVEMMEGVCLWKRWRIEKSLQKSLSMTYDAQWLRRWGAEQGQCGTPVEYSPEANFAA